MSTNKNAATELQTIRKRTSGRLSLVNCSDQSKDRESAEKKEAIDENLVEKNEPKKGELARSNSIKRRATTREALALSNPIVTDSSSPQTSANETNSTSSVKGRVFFKYHFYLNLVKERHSSFKLKLIVKF